MMLGLWILAACPVELEGDAGLAADLRAQLEVAGESIEAAGCEAVRARVERSEAGLRVALVDDRGNEHWRAVSTTTVAALLVESWSRKDLVASLLDPVPPPIAPPEPGAPRAIAPAAAFAEAQPQPIAAPPPELGFGDLALLGEVGLGSDGGSWLGAAVQGHLRWAWLEPALLVRFTHGTRRTSALQTGAARHGAEALIGADLALDLGALSLRGGLLAGVGWLATERFGRPACVDCVLDAWVGDQLRVSSFGPRVELRAGAALELGAGVAAELRLSGTAAPLAREDDIAPAYAESLAPGDRFKLSVPGEPVWTARLALGVSWGQR
jgi:hypothetical protein